MKFTSICVGVLTMVTIYTLDTKIHTHIDTINSSNKMNKRVFKRGFDIRPRILFRTILSSFKFLTGLLVVLSGF
jgi:hypothetical protein